MWTEASSSVPHFLQVGLLLSPIIYICLFKVLCPVSRPVTTLDCFPLKDNNRSHVARSWTENNSQACLCVLLETRHNTGCCFQSVSSFFLYTVYRTPRKVRVQQTVEQNHPSWACQRFLPLTPACPGTQYSPTLCWVEISYAFWHFLAKAGIVLAAWIAFRAAWLSEQILHNSLVDPEFQFHEHRLVSHIHRPERL